MLKEFHPKETYQQRLRRLEDLKVMFEARIKREAPADRTIGGRLFLSGVRG
jgi:hypothetical protein